MNNAPSFSRGVAYAIQGYTSLYLKWRAWEDLNPRLTARRPLVSILLSNIVYLIIHKTCILKDLSQKGLYILCYKIAYRPIFFNKSDYGLTI